MKPWTQRYRPLLVGVSLLLASSACTLVIVSGPSTVATGTTVSYDLEVGGSGGGSHTFYVVAYVPEGWNLTSSSYSGTVGGDPIAGSGALVANSPCGSQAVIDGFKQVRLEAGPFSVLSSDTADVTLEFLVNDQPAGQYQIYFGFGTVDRCSGLLPKVINRTVLPRLIELLSNDGDNDGLDGEGRLAVAPDGKRLYTSSVVQDSVSTYQRDPISGELAYTESLVGPGGPKELALSHDGQLLFLLDGNSNAIWTYAVDREDGTLELREVVAVGGGDYFASGIAVSPDDRHLYVGSYDSPIQQESRVWIFEIIHEADVLRLDPVGFEPGVGPCCNQGVAVSSDGATLYAGQEHSVLVYSRDEQTGSLQFLESHTDGVAGVVGTRAAKFFLETPDTRHLIVSSPFELGAIAIFRRGLDGRLVFHDALFSGVDLPPFTMGGNLTAVGDHRILMRGDGLTWLTRDPATGDVRYERGLFGRGPGTPELRNVNRILEVGGGFTSHAYVRTDEGYLAVLDTSPGIFADGFESGDTSKWR